MAVRLCQAVLMTFSILIVMRMFGEFYGAGVGTLTGFLLTFNPILAKADVFLDKTLLPIFFITLFLWSFFKEKPASAGIYMGLTALCNAAFLIFYPIAVLILYLRKGVKSAGTMLLLTVLVLTPWTLRNYFVFKRFIPIRSSAPIQLWLANNPMATGGITQYGGANMPYPDGLDKANGEMDSMAVYEQAAKDYIRHHPKRFVVLRARAFFYFWMTSRPWLGYGEKIDILNVAGAIFLLLTFIPGLVIAFQQNRSVTWVWILFFASYVSVFTLTCADSIDRYRLPLDPFLLGFSAVFFNYFFKAKEPASSL